MASFLPKRAAVGHTRGMATAMVLCAGFGTRLRPLTEALPKPMVPLGDRPLLGHILDRLTAEGVTSLVVNGHHQYEEISSYIQYLKDITSINAFTSVERAVLGTAGGIRAARSLFGDAPIIVHNGDILTKPPVAELLANATDGLCLAVCPRPVHQGSVGLDERGCVVRLRGKVFGREVRSGDFMGVSALGPRCLATLPVRGCLVGDWALPELEAGGSIATISTDSDWTDIGSLTAYLQANLDWLEVRNDFVADTAELGPEVRLKRSIVGNGAVVRGSGMLEDCVIWPGATAFAPLCRTVVMGNGRSVAVARAG